MTVGGVLGIVALCLITKLPATKCLEIVRNVTSCDGLKAGTEVLVRDVSSKLETSLTPSEQAAAFASVGLHAIKNEWDNGVAGIQVCLQLDLSLTTSVFRGAKNSREGA